MKKDTREYLRLLLLFVLLPLVSFPKQITTDDLNALPLVGTISKWEHTAGISHYIRHDINRDGIADIITSIKRKELEYAGIHIYSENQQLIDIKTIHYDLLAMSLIEKDNGDQPQLLTLGLKNKFNLIFTLYSLNKNTIEKIRERNIFEGSDRNGDGKWDISESYNAFFKIPGRTDKILLLLNTGYDLYPRGLYQIDLDRLNIDWRFEMGGSPRCVHIDDVDHDGHHEITFITASPDNHYCYNEISDTSAYLIRLSEQGNLLHKEVIAPQYTYGALNKYYITSDTYLYLINANSHSIKKQLNNYMAFLDPITLGLIYVKRVTSPFDNIKSPLMINKIIFQEIGIPVFSNLESMQIVDHSLSVIKTLKIDQAVVQIFSADLNNDRLPEFLVRLAPGEYFTIFDKDMNLIGRQKYFSHMEMQVFSNDQYLNSKIYFIMDYLYEWIVPYAELKPHIIYTGEWIVFPRLSFLIILLASLVLTLYISIYYYKKLKLKSALQNFLMQNFSTGLMILGDNLKIETMNQRLKEQLHIDDMELENTHINTLLSHLGLHLINQSSTGLNTKDLSRVFSTYLERQRNHKYSCTISEIKTFNKKVLYILSLRDLNHTDFSNRLATWGMLAQRMAHEIKNPLTTLLLTLRQIQKKFVTMEHKEQEKFDHYIQSACEEIERLRNSTNSLMRFTSTLDDELEKLSINTLIKESLNKFVYLENIRISIDLTEDLPVYMGDEKKIRQVLCNIIENSIDAIRGDGVIDIRSLFCEEIDPVNGNVKQWIQIEIIDNGEGIAEENMIKIFEPNFTTKVTGSGFGLAISKLIIDQLEGELAIKSKIGQGTSVLIKLPLEQLDKS